MAAAALLLSILFCVGVGEASAADAPKRDPSDWVLPPEVGPELQRAFVASGVLLRLGGASLSPSRVELRVCLEGACFDAVLVHPARCSYEVRQAAFCIESLTPSNDGVRRELLRVIGTLDGAKVWRRPGTSGAGTRPGTKPRQVFADHEHRPEAGFDPVSPNAHPHGTALFLLILPVLFGFGLAFGARVYSMRSLGRWRPESRWAKPEAWGGRLLGACLLLFPVLVAALIPPHAVQIGFWDLLLGGLLLGIGAFLGAHESSRRLGWREALLGSLSLLVALGLLELGARRLLPPPPAFPPPESAQVFLPVFYGPSDGRTWCQLYPDHYPREWAKASVVRRKATTRVLHVGDSMTYGSGVRPHERFTALLDAMKPEVAHLNGSVPGSGTDLQLLVIRQWLKRVRLDLVVLHFFVGNDIYDMNRPYPACDDQPVLRYTEAGPVPRCPQPLWGGGGRRLKSPAPYALRVSTSFSVAAQHICALLWRISHSRVSSFDESLAWRQLEAVLRAIRDAARTRGVPLVVNLIPYRASFEEKSANMDALRRHRRKSIELMRRLDVPAIDPHDLFAKRVRVGGSGALFLASPPGDVHFNPKGHRLMADVLAEELPRFLRNR